MKITKKIIKTTKKMKLKNQKNQKIKIILVIIQNLKQKFLLKNKENLVDQKKL